MKISSIKGLSGAFLFKSKVIDAHVHSGDFLGKSYPITSLDIFVKSPLNVEVQGEKRQDIISAMLISNLSCLGEEGALDETEGNLEMLELSKTNKAFYPLAVCEPKKTNGNPEKIEELLKYNKGEFVGLKFHPTAENLRADDSRYKPYLELARAHNLPCLFHSEVNIDWSNAKNGAAPIVIKEKENWSNSDPRLIYELAKQYPDVPIVLAHLGAGGKPAHKLAQDILLKSIDNKDANLYCDISWVDFDTGISNENPESLISLIDELKKRNALDRVLFGTDAPLGCYGEVTRGDYDNLESYEKTISDTKTAIMDNFPDDGEEIIQKIFFDNANDLFLSKY